MTTNSPPLVLASASPRRRELLLSLGLRFEVVVPDVSEHPRPDETAREGVRRLAASKAERVRAARPGCLVLAADTLVVLEEEGRERVLGKPSGPGEAESMLRALSGREHTVLTGLALRGPRGRGADDVAATRVRFAPLDDERIRWYVSTGEPLDKAGAYGVQGAAALLIPELNGSWSNVVGLPLDRLPALFEAAGHDLMERLRA